jgi:hypothetical protein
MDILKLLVTGSTIKDAAAQFGIGYCTADEYIRSVYVKLQVRSRAIAKAVNHQRDDARDVGLQRGALFRRQILSLRRHLVFIDPVMDANPTLARRVIGEIKLQRGTIEAALGGFFVVALDAALLDLRRLGREPQRDKAKEKSSGSHENRACHYARSYTNPSLRAFATAPVRVFTSSFS